MKFTPQTLAASAKRFKDLLHGKGLGLPFTKAINTWSQIVLGKNYSAAMSHAKVNGVLQAELISETKIHAIFQVENRKINSGLAWELIAEAVREDLHEISPSMENLVHFCVDNQSRLIHVFSDPTGLGIISATAAGYLPVSNTGLLDEAENAEEIAWLNSNAEMVCSVVNLMTDFGQGKIREIFFINFRLNSKKHNEVFRSFFSDRITGLSKALGQGVIDSFNPTKQKNWKVDFDKVRDLVFEIIDSEISDSGFSWLKADCSLGDMVMDHLAAQIRGTLTWIRDEALDGRDDDDPVESVTYTSQLALNQTLGA